MHGWPKMNVQWGTTGARHVGPPGRRLSQGDFDRLAVNVFSLELSVATGHESRED